MNFVRFLGILCITLFLKKYFSTEIGFHLPGPPFYFWFIVTVWRLPLHFVKTFHLFDTSFYILITAPPPGGQGWPVCIATISIRPLTDNIYEFKK